MTKTITKPDIAQTITTKSDIPQTITTAPYATVAITIFIAIIGWSDR